MKNEAFTNIREQQQIALNGGETSAFFGRSSIFFENELTSKNANESALALNACVNAGILKPDTLVGQRAIRHDNGLSFVELTVGEEQNTFNTSARVLSPNPRKFLETGDLASLTEAQKVTIISGQCLFSAPTAIAHLADGSTAEICNPGQLESTNSKVLDITVDDRLQAYEADSVLRLTKVISAVNPNDREVEVALNIPKVEYYFYILDAFQKGLVDRDLAKKWFDLVDVRALQMERLIGRRVPNEFSIRGISPLSCVEDKLKRMVESGEKDILSKIVSSLKTQSIFWNFGIGRNDPQRFSDISHLSYVMANLLVTQDGTTLPIAVENPEETPIVRNLKKTLGEIGLTMILLYPHSNAVPKEEPKSGKFNNYFVETPDNLSSLKQIVRLNRQQ